MKKIPIIITLFLMIGNLKAQNNLTSFSLQEALDYGMTNSPDLRDAQINIADADERIEELKAIGLPQVNFSSSFNHFLKLPVTILPEEFGLNPVTGMPDPNFNPEVQFGVKNQFDFGLEVSSLLFDGSYLYGLQAARLYSRQVREQLTQQKDVIRNNVRDAYLPALIIVENEVVLDKNIKNLERLLFETKELYKAGFVEQLDVDRLELSLANIQVEKESLERQKDIVLNVLKFRMGYPQDQEITLEDNLESLLAPASDADLNAEIDYRLRSEYTIVETAIELNQLNVKRFKAGYWPQLVAFGGYGVTWQGDNFRDGNWADNAVVGLQLNVPIFDGFEKRAKIQRANLQLESVKNRRVKLEEAITLEIRNARETYRNAFDRVESRKKNLALAEKIYETSRIKYKEGVGSSLEISQAEQSLYESQANLLNARYDLLVAKINLDKAIGR